MLVDYCHWLLIYHSISMWCEHSDVMAKLLPLFLEHAEGIDVVQSAMAEQFEKCIQWYVPFIILQIQ